MKFKKNFICFSYIACAIPFSPLKCSRQKPGSISAGKHLITGMPTALNTIFASVFQDVDLEVQ